MSRKVTVVFCEDIRQEFNGKHILIGTYGTHLMPAFLPQELMLSVWIRISETPRGKSSFRVVLETDDGQVGIDGDYKLPENSPISGAVFAVGPFPVPMSKPGTIRAKFAFADEELQEVETLTVTSPDSTPPRHTRANAN